MSLFRRTKIEGCSKYTIPINVDPNEPLKNGLTTLGDKPRCGLCQIPGFRVLSRELQVNNTGETITDPTTGMRVVRISVSCSTNSCIFHE